MSDLTVKPGRAPGRASALAHILKTCPHPKLTGTDRLIGIETTDTAGEPVDVPLWLDRTKEYLVIFDHASQAWIIKQRTAKAPR